MTLTPAYGRDYRSQKEVLAAFYAGRDFLLQQMLDPVRPINIDQIPVGTHVQFRYGQMTKVLGHQVKKKQT